MLHNFLAALLCALGPSDAAAARLIAVPRTPAPLSAPAAAGGAGRINPRWNPIKPLLLPPGGALPARRDLVAPIPTLTIAPITPALVLPAAAPILAARADETQGRGARPPGRAPEPEPDAETREQVTGAIWEQLAALESAREENDFARRTGLRILLTPFEKSSLLGLDPDNAGQYEPEDRLIYLNWSLAAQDLAPLSRRFGPQEARRLTALALAPVAAHEARHALLRAEHGENFPAVREEEIVTHARQAAVFDEILRGEGFGLAEIDSFLFQHSRKAWERWREGFGSLARFVLRKYEGFPSLEDAPADNAARARAQLAEFESNPAATPSVWLSRARAAVSFWEDPAAVARLIDFLRRELLEVSDNTRRHASRGLPR